MKQVTIEQFNAYLARQAELNNLPFNVLAKNSMLPHQCNKHFTKNCVKAPSF